jgi:hypothetical protein
LHKFSNSNCVLSTAMSALYRTVNKVEGETDPDVDLGDAIMLQECASVIARSSACELLSALKGLKTGGRVKPVHSTVVDF